MTSVQPFSYLTAQPAPSKPAFQRQEDDLAETVPASDGEFRAGNTVNVQEDVGGHFSQSSAALPYHAMDYQRPQVNLGRSQTETSYDLRQHQQQQQQQPEMVFTGNQVKRPPDVAPKQQTKSSDPPPRMPDNNWEEGLYGGANNNRGGGVGGALYEQSNPLSTIDRLQERTDPVGDPDFGNAANNLYGQLNRQRKPDVQDTKKTEPQTTTNNYVPFSYTQPIGLSGVVPYGDMESRNGIGPKNYYSPPSSEPLYEVRPRDSPSPPPAVSPLENQTIFENFILVGPEKPSYPAPPPKEQPAKRLKLQELFDPPPPKPQAPAVLLQDPRKLSIFGVTNTESSDYQSSANHSKRPNGDRSKTPVSTFDNPDYNLPSDGSRAYTTPSGSVQGTSDDRSWSVGATNTFDGAASGKGGTGAVTAAGFSKQRRPTPLQGREKEVNNKTCIAVLVTAIVAGIFCLGAGFIAGWFGRGRSLGY